MTEPKRIQLKRAKGWKMPAGTIVVSRPSPWGNPYQVERTENPDYTGDGAWYVDDQVGVEFFDTEAEARRYAIDCYAMWLSQAPRLWEADRDLRGHDLACWCALDVPCHADILLRIANSGALGETGKP